MPNFNQTGPMGQGSMTGRRMGRCTNNGANLKSNEVTTSENLTEKQPLSPMGRGAGFGLGRGGRGRGMGRGMGRQNRFRGGV
ncbi:MAG: hypothetical protein EHM93_14200 [Bacteroidales bacterium]|jgi:hypothetical protein|nr:MAG: hypothetical protein EHM93_14200 [Bacteroidales bacterium]